MRVHAALSDALEAAVVRIREIQEGARARGFSGRPRWPMIVLRTPKGWTGPKVVDGQKIEGTFRAHQLPIADFESKPEHIALLETWMRSYRPEELFDENGTLVGE